ncbi:hypothetical protein JHK87_031750 [Glycine soja]|nr:hypothetical protein JHK87_031750 [Glycine soja]
MAVSGYMYSLIAQVYDESEAVWLKLPNFDVEKLVNEEWHKLILTTENYDKAQLQHDFQTYFASLAACFVFFTDQWKQHRVSPKNEDEVRPSNLQR